jgi:putative ABC transport system permease protein
MLKNYFITAMRNLWRNKFFSAINIFGLSVGIACCMLIFLYASDEITFDRFHGNADRIYRITADMIDNKGEVNRSGNSGWLQGPRFTAGIPEIEEFVRVQSYGCTVKKGPEVYTQDALCVDENFFSVFSFPLLCGDKRTALKDPYGIVISEDVALKYFGKKQALNEILTLKTGEEFKPFKVTGVAKNTPLNSSLKIGVLFSRKLEELADREKPHWMNFFLNTFIVLKPGTDVNSVIKKCNLIYEKEAAPQIKDMKEKYDYDEKVVYDLQPLTDLHLSTDYPAQNGLINASNAVYSYILLGIAVFILIIACINFVNLSVARSLKRAKEIGVRKVIGGKRKQLIIQFLGESFLLAGLSFVIAILLAFVSLPFFNELSEKSLAFSYLLDLRLVVGYFLLFLLTSLLAGIYPSLVLSAFNPVETLYGKLRYSAKNYFSQGLVVLQFTLATILIISTITVYKQFDFLTHYELGYDKSNVLKATCGNMNIAKLEMLKAELRNETGVKNVSAQQGGEFFTVARINGAQNQEFGFMRIDEDYFPMYNIPVIKGRNFSKQFPADSTGSVLVNETFVKAAGWKEPIGETVDFYYNKKKYNVVGVVHDFHTAALTEKIQPYVFSIDPQLSYGVIFLKIDPSRKNTILKHVEKTLKEFFPNRPLDYGFVEDIVNDQYKSEAKWKQIILFGAILTIFISCIGLFGLAALSAERRAKEIGIRKVLGASVALLVKKLSADFLKLVVISAVIALPVAWWAANKWLENYPYRIELNTLMFGSAVIVVLVIAMVAVSYQAFKAAVANPIKSLRSE